MADRAVFQMAEAASQDKKVLGRNRERRQNPDLLSDYGLLHDGHRPEETGYPAVHLRDVTDSKYLTYRHNRSENLVRQI